MNLDEMLKDQDKIQDDGFSAGVMARLPKKKKSKRGLILGTCVSIGSITAIGFLGGHDTFNQIFQSPIIPLGIAAMTFTTVMTSLFFVANEEL